MTDRTLTTGQRLVAWSDSHGYQVAWGPARVLESAQADLEMRRATGELEREFARSNLSFDHPPRSADSDRWRVVVVVMPRPAHLVSFTVCGRRVEAVLPPTYERYRPVFEDLRRQLVTEALPSSRVEIIDVPLKAVATRLGLVRYGKNNITYGRSIGSYLQLAGFVTDAGLPLDPDWRESPPLLLDECADCAMCEAVCPTDAISADRMLLHAERCLTVVNETAGAWPPWLGPSVHHCLVGCLRCQQACPANPELRFEDTGVVFDERETSSLVAGADGADAVLDSIREKLALIGQPGLAPALGRNLQALIVASRPERAGRERRR